MNQIIEKENIKNLIYEVRGRQVMLDRDLARLYNVETKALNQAVKRNIERFPSEFCFQMDNKEFNNWRSQFVTSNNDKIGLRRPPFVFIEQCEAMLSSVIKAAAAEEISVRIMMFLGLLKSDIASKINESQPPKKKGL